jgi:hypothetical protein
MKRGRTVSIKANITSYRPEIISQSCSTLFMEHMEEMAQCHKQPEDTGKDNAEMLM